MVDESLFARPEEHKIRCNYCSEELPVSSFYKSRIKIKHLICKKCLKSTSSYSWGNQKKEIDSGVVRKCATCNIELPQFTYATRCSPCSKKEVTERYRKRFENDKKGIPRKCSGCKKIKSGTGTFGYAGGRPSCNDCLRDSTARWKYGLTKDGLSALKSITTCEICGIEFGTRARRHIDHCHKTKKVRGVLCSRCNVGIGMFKENRRIFIAAMKYLEQHKDSSNGCPYLGSSAT